MRNALQGCVSGKKKFGWYLLLYTTLPLDFKAKHLVELLFRLLGLSESHWGHGDWKWTEVIVRCCWKWRTTVNGGLILTVRHSLLDSLEDPEVQVVLVAVEEAAVVAEDQPPGVAAPLDVVQLNVVLVPTVTLITHIFPSGPESTAALVQTAVNLKVAETKFVLWKYVQMGGIVKVPYLVFKGFWAEGDYHLEGPYLLIFHVLIVLQNTEGCCSKNSMSGGGLKRFTKIAIREREERCEISICYPFCPLEATKACALSL